MSESEVESFGSPISSDGRRGAERLKNGCHLGNQEWFRER